MRSNAIIIAINSGKLALTILSKGTFPTAEETNKLTTTGGVMKPIAKLTTIMTPKCIGSTRNTVETGNRIDVKITIAAIVSIQEPTINKNILIKNNIIIGLSEMETIVSASCDGIRSIGNQ